VIRLGTRGSKLALAQSRVVAEQLERLGAEVEIKIVTTTGDRCASGPPDTSTTGIFVKELETALLDGGIDLAVHSLKDMTTTLPEGLRLGAVLARGSPFDALISRERGLGLDDLPEAARVGTSSPRRRAQLLHYRPDLRVPSLRGNVDTRLRKLDAGEFDAVVVAHAGLERLGVEDARPWVIPPEVCLPAPGQGALAVEIRTEDGDMASLVEPLDDSATRACVTAERAFLRALGGGCRAAVGALARIEGEMLHLDGAVASPDGKRLLRGAFEGDSARADAVGQALARDFQQRGAAALIEAGR